jgi:hypothetical protein
MGSVVVVVQGADVKQLYEVIAGMLLTTSCPNVSILLPVAPLAPRLPGTALATQTLSLVARCKLMATAQPDTIFMLELHAIFADICAAYWCTTRLPPPLIRRCGAVTTLNVVLTLLRCCNYTTG